MAEIRTLLTRSLTVLAIGLCACPPALHAQAVNAQPQTSDKQKPLLLWLNAGFYSAHFDIDKGLRNSNPGLGVEAVINEDWSATAGTFTNSDDARSNVSGWPRHLDRCANSGLRFPAVG